MPYSYVVKMTLNVTIFHYEFLSVRKDLVKNMNARVFTLPGFGF